MKKSKFIAAPYVIWMALFIIIPLFFIVYYAFTNSSGQFTFDNITQLRFFTPVFIKSIWYSVVATAVCLLIAFPISYYVSRLDSRKQSLIVTLLMIPMYLSFLLRTLAWVSLLQDTGYINDLLEFIGIGRLKLLRTPAAVIFGMVYNYLPYMILPLYTVMLKIDKSTLEAAEDLGAGNVNKFGRIILPLSMPGIVSGVTMVFVPAVSTFYISQKMGGPLSYMIGDAIETTFKSSNNLTNLGAAMSLILMLIVLISMGIMSKIGPEEEAIIL